MGSNPATLIHACGALGSNFLILHVSVVDEEIFLDELIDGLLLRRICSVFVPGAEKGVNKNPKGVDRNS